MVFFTPKISKIEMEAAKSLVKQARESSSIYCTTTNPEVFFKRLNFTLDTLLELQRYEKYKIMSPTPSSEFDSIICNMEKIVDSFIDRALDDCHSKIAKLKTPAAKKKKTGKSSAKQCFVHLIKLIHFGKETQNNRTMMVFCTVETIICVFLTYVTTRSVKFYSNN